MGRKKQQEIGSADWRMGEKGEEKFNEKDGGNEKDSKENYRERNIWPL